MTVYNLAGMAPVLSGMYGAKNVVTDYTVRQVFVFLLFLYDKSIYEDELHEQIKRKNDK